MIKFAGKSYVITGGFSGIGLSTVTKLLERSATVHILDRADSAPSSFLDHEAQSPGKLYTYPSIDITSRESVAAAFVEIFQRSPEIHGLINSAGVCPYSGGLLEDDQTFDTTVAVNLQGTWNVTAQLLRHIEKASSEFKGWVPGDGGVSIVNLGSTASYIGLATMNAYCASKHAVLGLTRSWAKTYAALGVRVNLVAPGGTQTPLAQQQFGGGERGEVARDVYPLIPMKRFGEPEELADSILFLLSDQSSYITGQILKVNGGWP
ncbi:short chain alcohol dehydrogenase [Diaporthe sp. PMI_573]|nr:short chain alcohol dehydrogenase [Diaporthaceae sp. PMI_573]